MLAIKLDKARNTATEDHLGWNVWDERFQTVELPSVGALRLEGHG